MLIGLRRLRARQLWYRKVRSRHLRHVRVATRPYDEVCYPRYHGWYHCCESPLLYSAHCATHVRSDRSTVSSCLSSFPATVSCLIMLIRNAYAHARITVSIEMSLFQGFVQLGAGLSVGLAGLAAGFAIGIVGDAGVRGTAQQPRLFVGMVCLPELSPSAHVLTILVPLDSHSHFRRSLGSLWAHCCAHHELASRRLLRGKRVKSSFAPCAGI